MMNPSKEQLQAIQSHHENVLVNAGAGSGKTWVLGEHVLYLMKNYNYHILDFLIVTFTNAAANEMKTRIKNMISNDDSLKKYADNVEFAHIQTFDAFNLFLVKKFHDFVQLQDEIDIQDKSIFNIEIEKYINEELDKYYESDNSLLHEIINIFCDKDDQKIHMIISDIINYYDSCIDGDTALNNLLINPYNYDFINKAIGNYFSNIKLQFAEIFNKIALFSPYKDIYEFYLNQYNRLDFSSYDNFLSSIKEVNFPNKNSKGARKIKKDDPDLYDMIGEIGEVFKKIKEKIYNFGYFRDIVNHHIHCKEYLELFVDIAKKVIDRLNKFKKDNCIYDFNDISKFALVILNNDECLKIVKNEFKYIMIDEYQDTNDIQEALISKLENSNVFMVGDVKQSIYRFRNANCVIFLDKYLAYKNLNGGSKIDMTLNFRSRKEIIDGINLMFDFLMTRKTNLIDYKDGHISFYGQKSYDKKIANYDYGINFLTYDCEKYKLRKYQYEIIAKDIINKISNKMKLLDTSKGEYYDCTFKDFAIIVDRNTNFDEIIRVFNEYQIPIFAVEDSNILNNDISSLIFNLMNLVYLLSLEQYDTNDFKHSYISVIRSFIYSYDDEKIYNLFKQNDYTNDGLFLLTKDITKHLNELSLYNLTCLLIEKTNLLNKIINLNDFHSIHLCINSFLDKINALDNLGYSLEDFIVYFNQIKDSDEELKGSNFKLDDNVVTLTNIHKSKGLEYKVCYYVDLDKKFNISDIKKTFLISKDYGLVCNNYEKGYNVNSFFKQLHIDNLKQADFEEKLRLLYVALTRAKEMIYIVLPLKEKDKIPIKSINDSNNFKKILLSVYQNFKNINADNLLEEDIKFENLSSEEKDLNFGILDCKQIEYTKISKVRASKETSYDIDENLLIFGNRLHHLLQLTDFEKKDTSFIRDNKLKTYIDNVLKQEIFSNLEKSTILKEYEFYDEINHVNGIIDCLIIKEHEILIVDYKTKQIDDELYNVQLQTYKNFIKQLTNKNIRLYLLSIIDNKIKEVK